ncbi:hypothetical protein ACQUW5_05015 [Legionella sp. CNM-1927-20]|uniref:hypothetical protein n=1 Tax=Legionella sp. CNM-1927-20 TaxID=3422221 RepID=UPI00403A9392
MLITREPIAQKKIQFRIRMSVQIYEQVMQYCQWAGINKRDFFIEEACKYILNNDTEWIKYKQNKDLTDLASLSNQDISIMPLQDKVCSNESNLSMNEMAKDN